LNSLIFFPNLIAAALESSPKFASEIQVTMPIGKQRLSNATAAKLKIRKNLMMGCEDVGAMTIVSDCGWRDAVGQLTNIPTPRWNEKTLRLVSTRRTKYGHFSPLNCENEESKRRNVTQALPATQRLNRRQRDEICMKQIEMRQVDFQEGFSRSSLRL
jgi:hypothetical protein